MENQSAGHPKTPAYLCTYDRNSPGCSGLCPYKFRLKEGQIRIGVNAAYIITCLIGGLIMGKSIRQRRFFWGLTLGLVYFLVLLAVSFLLNKGLNGTMNQILTTMAI